MFNKRGKSVTAEVAGSIGESLKYSTGNTVVLVQGGTIMAVRLDTPYPPYGGEKVVGPADVLASTLADVIRHVTGTPPTEVEPEEEPIGETPGTSGPPAATFLAQVDLLGAISDQVEGWRRDGAGTAMISFSRLEGYLGELGQQIHSGRYIERAPF